MITLLRPTPAAIDAYLGRVRQLPFSYPEVAATRQPAPPPGYVIDHNRIQLGRGDATFRAARECLRNWDMFRLGWVNMCWPHVAPEPGNVVASLAHVFGVWWLNPCRVVYADDQPDRFRFAYGTLAGHVECGEERFTVERLADDTVWYDIYAFSRPGAWLTRVGYPLARRLQRRFGRDSLATLAAAVRERSAEVAGVSA